MSKREFRRVFNKVERASVGVAFESVSHNFSNGILAPDAPAIDGAIMPGESAVRDMAEQQDHPQFYRRWVTFRDVNGIGWVRDLSDGRLMASKSLRAFYRQTQGFLHKCVNGNARDTVRWWLSG